MILIERKVMHLFLCVSPSALLEGEKKKAHISWLGRECKSVRGRTATATKRNERPARTLPPPILDETSPSYGITPQGGGPPPPPAFLKRWNGSSALGHIRQREERERVLKYSSVMLVPA